MSEIFGQFHRVTILQYLDSLDTVPKKQGYGEGYGV
jgi:hypothetical protein